MKDWYLTKEAPQTLIHRGKKITQGSLIRLTPNQAAQHSEAVAKSEEPTTILDCAFPFEFEEWQQEKQEPAPKKSRKNKKIETEE